jgi:hypothetical protein
MNNTFFVNSQKTLTPVNSTQALADELKTSKDTAGRIIQIQAKAAHTSRPRARRINVWLM